MHFRDRMFSSKQKTKGWGMRKGRKKLLRNIFDPRKWIGKEKILSYIWTLRGFSILCGTKDTSHGHALRMLTKKIFYNFDRYSRAERFSRNQQIWRRHIFVKKDLRRKRKNGVGCLHKEERKNTGTGWKILGEKTEKRRRT